MLTLYLIGFAITFVIFWIFFSEKTYKESTDMFCSLVFSFTWPLWIVIFLLALLVAAYQCLYKK